MSGLLASDLRYVAQRLPRDIRDLLKMHGDQLYVGGGFIRALVAKEEVNDIDIFGPDPQWLEHVANGLAAQRPGSRLHKTKNAITLITPDRLPVQFIRRWTFEDSWHLVESFDFTVCQAAVWRAKGGNGEWRSRIGDRFYADLAGKNLVYLKPKREEEPGGSLLRVIKYVKRGYSIQVGSLGAVLERVVAGVKPDTGVSREEALIGLLREVDPLLVIDGFEVVDDHEPVEGGQ